MSLGSSLFILAMTVLVVILILPIRFHIQAEHHHRWNMTVQLQILWFRISVKSLRDKWMQSLNQQTARMKQRMESERHTEERSIQLYWKPILSFLWQGLHIIAKRIEVEQLYLRCCIGWSRADYTAYSYGLFWALLSVLPRHWAENGTFIYEPDYQQARQDVVVQSIIRSSVAQIIGILATLFALTVRMILAQNRKEQMRYET